MPRGRSAKRSASSEPVTKATDSSARENAGAVDRTSTLSSVSRSPEVAGRGRTEAGSAAVVQSARRFACPGGLGSGAGGGSGGDRGRGGRRHCSARGLGEPRLTAAQPICNCEAIGPGG